VYVCVPGLWDLPSAQRALGRLRGKGGDRWVMVVMVVMVMLMMVMVIVVVIVVVRMVHK
jgi:hypothetical protein